MKNHTIIATIIPLCIAAFFPRSPAYAQCTKSELLYQYYEWEIKNIALLRIEAFDHPDKDKVEIPEVWQDTVWEALSAVFNATDIPERDSIFDIFCIHHGSGQHAAIQSGMYVKLDTAFAWVKHWGNQEKITGNTFVDSIMAPIDFEIDNFFFNFFQVVKIDFSQPINQKALARILDTIPGVVYAEQDQTIGDGGWILYDMQDGIRQISFSAGLGDCQAGCLYRIFWGFDIYPDCNVVFTGRQGMLNPVFQLYHQNCNITSDEETVPYPETNHFWVPNPFNNQLRITFENDLQPASRITVCDVTGRIVYENNQIYPGMQINTTSWHSGIYSVKYVFPEGRVGVQQLVKYN